VNNSLTANPLFNRGWIDPAGSSSVIPAEIEIFKVNRDTKEAAKMWNAEPFAEAAGDDLNNNALAQNVFKSMRNQEGALVEALEALHKAQAAFEDELTFVKPFIDKEGDIVRLNIMGSLVDVSLSVVRLHEESMLATLFDSKKWQAQPQNLDQDGRYLLVSRGKALPVEREAMRVYFLTSNASYRPTPTLYHHRRSRPSHSAS